MPNIFTDNNWKKREETSPNVYVEYDDREYNPIQLDTLIRFSLIMEYREWGRLFDNFCEVWVQ